MHSPQIAIIGAGISGLACATRLQSHNINPFLFDKGKRAGGRLSTLVIENKIWDFGCPYFTVTRPEFATQTRLWREAGWLAPWTQGPVGAMVGVPTMASLIAQQCAAHNIRFLSQIQHLTFLNDQWYIEGPQLFEGPFDVAILTLPSQQAAPLLSLHDLAMAREAACARSSPCWSLMIEFEQALRHLPPFIQSDGPIARAFRTNSKPQRLGAETWVIQASASWSEHHLEDDRHAVATSLLDLFQSGSPAPLPPYGFLKAHRWRFATSYGSCDKILWNPQLRLGACGDWCMGSGVEDAWISGRNLAEHIITHL